VSDASPVSPVNYAKAIEAYEATLVTPAALDRFLSGQEDALNETQKAGLRIFVKVGCSDCHSGSLLGGEGVQKFGVHHDYWTMTGSEHRDAGLFESTNNEDDRYRFRTSILRNIEKTAPYFHDGSVSELAEAVRIMAKVQLDQDLDTAEVRSIVAFLQALTGDVPANYSDPFADAKASTNRHNERGN
jgi:cytochrome c peroxidase